VQLPEVTVEYDNINVEADALVGSASIPSLSNVALGILKVSTGLGGNYRGIGGGWWIALCSCQLSCLLVAST